MGRSLRIAFVVILLAGLAAGCGGNSFVGKRYGNFTAYYNTFYNAQNTFEEGLKTLEREDQPVDRTVYMALFTAPDRAGNAKAFNEAITKSADVLREHPNSKWVDDALLLIGKSYFYLQNFVGAEQKFREVISLGSGLDGEARFWLARTLIASGSYDAASEHLLESLNRDDLSRRWEPRLRVALGELSVKREMWDEAATQLQEGIDAVRDSELAGRAQFLLGQVYETLGRYDEAAEAYDRVADRKPLYELAYAGQVSAIRVEGTHGDPESALRKLRRMERDDKNYANRAELAYLRGRIYQAMQRTDDALETYYAVLYNQDGNAGPVRGQTYYALGEIFRDDLIDYSLAAAYFDTAATSLVKRPQQGSEKISYAPAAITDSEEQRRTFNSFKAVMDQITEMDSLLALGSMSEEDFQAFILDLRRQRAEELAAQRREAERQQEEAAFQGNANFNSERTLDRSTTTQQNTQAGFLFHRDPLRIQQAQAEFVQRWGDRALLPNWRRIAGSSDASSVSSGEAGSIINPLSDAALQASTGGLPEVDITGVPRDTLSRTHMRNQRAIARYELANVLFLAMNQPDSAATLYRLVIEEEKDQDVAQRAYYALAEVQRALRDTTSSERLYETILERFPDSEFAGRARERLGRPALQTTVSNDSLALAEEAYRAAYEAWQSDSYTQALNDMVGVSGSYRETPVAPRALLAAGSVYLEWAQRDSLSLFDPLPLTVADSVLDAAGLLLFREPEPASQGPAATRDTTAVSDTLTLAGDSLALPVDPPGLPADTLVINDMPADSVAVQGAIPDSIRAAPDSLVHQQLAEPLPEPEPERVYLETIYTQLRALYPQTKEANQARLVLEALAERRAAADSAATAQDASPPDAEAAPPIAEEAEARADTTIAPGQAEGGAVEETPPAEREPKEADQADEPQAADEKPRTGLQKVLDDERALLQRRPQRQQEDMMPADTGEVVQPDEVPVLEVAPDPGEEDAVLRDEGVSASPAPTTSRWTLVVGSETDPARAEKMAARFREQLADSGNDVSVVASTDEQGTRYRIGVGAFPTQQAAQAARERLAAFIPEDARVFRIPQ